MAQVLNVYVAQHCFGTAEASRLAAEVRQELPDLHVEVVMLDDMPVTDTPCIPATPSYFLDNHLLFLGNPRLDELVAKIASCTTNQGDDYG